LQFSLGELENGKERKKMSIFNRNSMQERAGVSGAITSDLGPGLHPRISIRGGQFALVDAEGIRHGAPCILINTPQGQKMVMRVIIIGANKKKSRIFFERAYDQNNPGPPDCYSDNGFAPSVHAASPQARTCGECQWSKWGSDTSQLTGKKTKACSEKKKIAVLVLGDTTGLAYELQIPPATLKNMANYASKLKGHSPPGEQRPADPADCVTAISFISGQVGILEFAPAAWLNSEDAQNRPLPAPDGGAAAAGRIDEIWESGELDEILGLKDEPWTPPQLTGPLPGMIGFPTAESLIMQTDVDRAVVQAGSGPPTDASYTRQPAPQSPYAPAPNAAVAAPVFAFPSAAPSSPPSVQQPTQPQAPSTSASPRKRGRQPAAGTPQQEPAQLVAPFQPAAQADEIPDFLRVGNRDNAFAPTVAAGAAPNPAPSHGMVDAGPPPSGIAAALSTAFSLNTKRG
jgi:hypothetical protein